MWVDVSLASLSSVAHKRQDNQLICHRQLEWSRCSGIICSCGLEPADDAHDHHCKLVSRGGTDAPPSSHRQKIGRCAKHGLDVSPSSTPGHCVCIQMQVTRPFTQLNCVCAQVSPLHRQDRYPHTGDDDAHTISERRWEHQPGSATHGISQLCKSGDQ